ncbi:VOC family protein [Paenarthrobacter ilicis]|uniref:3-demethylubiquinone-9 3-methyltransferase (Glyoxalase superfamily) n=1 Tax=Paenarthrobacter ilicis TaxID=43665 RepID=A0ABX0TL12_9MICC|nr:putative 3-demethylubiquinone-9 3-methyltransferase (glyoxalase superfamily) [Paenarthrobacter ilicis]NIJ01900.1 putative 3-demethylubiquinone-9 3-methyltransferase (glyoxalase superfamily) [Paenarthrobacter ilicis]
MQKISTCLWFDGQAEEAALFYTGIFDNSSMGQTMPGPGGVPLTVEFDIEGRHFMGLNGGPAFSFNEAVSMVVNCETQEEVDRYWDALLEGGQESQCGWLKDKFGLSWQVVPQGMGEFLGGPDPEGSQRAMAAMMKMRKLDINALRAAYNSDQVTGNQQQVKGPGE